MNKNIKKIIALTIVLFSICSISACSQKEEVENKEQITEEEKIQKLEVELVGEETVEIFVGEEYVEQGIKVNKGSANVKVETKTVLNTSKPGVYSIEYFIKDEYGNVANLLRAVKVKEKEVEKVTPKKEESKPAQKEESKPVQKEETKKPETQAPTEQEQNGQVVYLTFDDGPSAYTEKLLEVLKENNVKATFFVTNTNSKYDYLLKKIVEEGHTLAIHTYSHEYGQIYKSKEAYLEDFNKIKEKIKNLTGVECKIFRFPGGSSNKVSMKYSSGVVTEIANDLTSKGYNYYDWNVDSQDASGKKYSSSQIAENVLEGLSPNRENFVLQHDIKPNSVDAVDTIIKKAKEDGYTFAKITEKSTDCKHKINN